MNLRKLTFILVVCIVCLAVSSGVMPAAAEETVNETESEGVREGYLGMENFSAAQRYYSIPENAIDHYHSAVHVESFYKKSKIHPALTADNDILYNDIDFHLYSSCKQPYQIEIYGKDLENPVKEYVGYVDNFAVTQKFLVPASLRGLKAVTVRVGPDVYTWKDVKVMHKDIQGEDEGAPVEEKKNDLIESVRSFLGGVLACIVFAIGFWRVWKYHLENSVQDVI